LHNCSSSFDYFKLGVGANPLHCDCDIRWLHSLLRSADSFRLSVLPWTCDTGSRFADLSDADFASCPPQQANCSDITPPHDDGQGNFGNSTGNGQLLLQVCEILLPLLVTSVYIHIIVGWQVTLCDPVWYVISYSSVLIFDCKLLYRLTLLSFLLVQHVV